MRRIVTFTILAFFMGFQTRLEAQHHSHSHNRNELGVSGGTLFSLEHKEWGAGIHLHYYHKLGEHSKWSLGGMIESAWVNDIPFYHRIRRKIRACEQV